MSIHAFDRRFVFGRLPARTLAAAAVAAALSASIANTALAQEARTENAADAGVSEVTVTGSRIVRRDLESSSPVVTVETKVFEESSTLAVESVLNQLPQFVPTSSTQFNTSDVFPSATSTPGI